MLPAFACVLLSSFVQGGLPDESLPNLQKAVIDSYGKMDHYSVSCFFGGADWPRGGNNCMGTMEYRFDRRTKRLAIGCQELVDVLVCDNELFMLVYHDRDNDVATYAKVKKPHPITWRDIDVARKLRRQECPLGGGFSCVPCFAWPFLVGGEKRLFPPNTKLLTRVGAKQGEALTNLTDISAAIFEWGHPDYKRFLVPDNHDKIDSKNYPICTRIDDDANTWTFAFERQSGNLIAALGVVDRRLLLGVPGNKYLVILKRVKSFGENKTPAGEFSPVPLELPPNAKVVAADGIKAACYAAMERQGLPSFVEQKNELKKGVKQAIEKVSHLRTTIAQTTAKDSTKLADLRQDLEAAEGDREMYSYYNTECEKVLLELQSRENRRLPK